MSDDNYLRYKYDSIIAHAITCILYVTEELSSNILRKDIRNFVHPMKDLMRKDRRQKDNNDGYIPSEAKISATIRQLLEWNWIERRESNKINSDEENAKTLRQIPKVSYSLSHEARFATDIGIWPGEDFQLEDAFHAVISSAAIGWDYIIWDKQLGRAKKINIEGTSTEEIKYRHDHNNITIGKYQRFSNAEIDRAIEIALERKIIQKKIIDNFVKYVIVENLSEFVSFCWRSLFMSTIGLVENMLVFKKIPKKSMDYQIIFSWFSKFHDISKVNEIIKRCYMRRTEYSKTERQELLVILKQQMKRNSLLKKEALDIYDKNIKAKDKGNFHNLRDAIIRYVCPETISDIAERIIPS